MNADLIATDLLKEIKTLLPQTNDLTQLELTTRQLLNQIATRTLSLLAQDLLQQTDIPTCSKCTTPMSKKRKASPTIHTTFGKIRDKATDFRCPKCRHEQRVRAFQIPPKARISPLFSTQLTLFGATWPEEIAAACALTTYGQKISQTTVHKLLQKEAEPGRVQRLKHPDSATVCSDGILVNGRQKKEKIEAKVAAIFSQTSEEGPKKKIKVKDASFVATSSGSWKDLGWKVKRDLLCRGASEPKKVLCVADGAKAIWGMFDVGVPGGMKQLDGYHMKKKVSGRCKEQFNWPDRREISQVMHEQLDVGDVDGAVETLMNGWAEKEAREGAEDENKAADKLVAYLRRNQKKIEKWVESRESGRNKGSGLQEKGNDLICGMRCKEGEMHWSREGLDAIMQHRCGIWDRHYRALQLASR